MLLARHIENLKVDINKWSYETKNDGLYDQYAFTHIYKKIMKILKVYILTNDRINQKWRFYLINIHYYGPCMYT